MEDKIEVNEYVRFNNGEIGKVIDIKENPSRIVYSEYGEIGLISDIVKHRKQLIDLIENKDILKVRIDKTIMVFGMDEDTSDIKYKELIENIENGEYDGTRQDASLYMILPDADTLHNFSDFPHYINPKDRIAQLIIQPYKSDENLEVTSQLDDTERGTGGFGSTGK